ncbi:MAG: N-ATPase subunit AtpR [Deferrisomatales bacterium]
MNDTGALALALASVAGALLGGGFFGGLWWTVRKGVSSPRPALWFGGSLVLRMAVVLAGFHAVGGGHWQRLLACLLGFAVARFAVRRLTGPPVHPPHLSPPQVAGHAPQS